MKISHLQSGKQSAYTVDIGDTTLFFSYETLVGVWSPRQHARIENVWGPTTGKHINAFGLKDSPVVEPEELAQIAKKEIAEEVAQ